MAKLTIARAGNVVTATDGKRTRQSICAGQTSAKSLETKLKNDPAMARRWMKATEAVQLVLPLPEPGEPEQLDIEDAIAKAPPRP
jgi:hypothetical protein